MFVSLEAPSCAVAEQVGPEGLVAGQRLARELVDNEVVGAAILLGVLDTHVPELVVRRDGRGARVVHVLERVGKGGRRNVAIPAEAALFGRLLGAIPPRVVLHRAEGNARALELAQQVHHGRLVVLVQALVVPVVVGALNA